MKAIVKLDVPDWQIGQDVTVYFQDTMMKHTKCELLKEQEAVKPVRDEQTGRLYWFCADGEIK